VVSKTKNTADCTSTRVRPSSQISEVKELTTSESQSEFQPELQPGSIRTSAMGSIRTSAVQMSSMTKTRSFLSSGGVSRRTGGGIMRVVGSEQVKVKGCVIMTGH
jgi:hypothetical protein